MSERRLEGDEVTVSPQVLSDLLSLVLDGRAVPPEVIATWTPAERNETAQWASAEHLGASDNPVKRLPKPELVQRAEDICASPAVAQLAVEGWLMHKERTESWVLSAGRDDVIATERAAQDAITGLLVLLGARARIWQEQALEVLAAHPEGVTPIDLFALLGRSCPSAEALHGWLAEGWANGTLGHPCGGTWALKENRL